MLNPLTLTQRVRALTIDTGGTHRISDASLMSWLNEALSGVATSNPLASTGFARITVPLTPATLHEFEDTTIVLPQGADEILQILQIPGVREVSERMMDLEEPGWRDALSVASSPLCWVRHGDSTRGFYTYPRLAGGAEVVALCCFRVSLIDRLSDTIRLSNDYYAPLTHWMAARAMRQDAENVSNQTLAQEYEQMYTTRLAELAQAEAARWNTRS